MRVAIVGCGLSGLATALFLKRRGVKTDIYEGMEAIADFPPRVEVLMSVYTKPVNDIPGYIYRRYGLGLKYYAPLNKIVWHTASATASAVGKLGVMTLRGRDGDSLDYQLADELDSKIWFRKNQSVQDLADYDWVIDASGQSDGGLDSRLYCFRGGTIRGQFNPNTMHIWHSSASTPKGFAYLLPHSSTTANVFIVIPLSAHDSSDVYLGQLWELLRRDLGFEPELIEDQEFRRVLTDQFPASNKNILPVGNSLGTATPFLGVDQFFALTTSFSTVQYIFGQEGPDRAMKTLYNHLNTMRVIHRAMDTWGDVVYDNLVRGMKVGASPFFASKRNLLAAVSFMLRPYVNVMGKPN